MTRSVDASTLVRVSRMYYELGETQATIAAAVGVTRPQVSKLLKESRAQGIVEIRVVDPDSRGSAADEALRRRFGLRAAHVAPTFAGSEEHTRRRVGALAAEVLLTSVRDGSVLGVGEGSAMAAMVDELVPPLASVTATVVPLCGGFWGTPGDEPYRRVADVIGATARGLLAPGLLEDAATRDALAAHAGIRQVTDLWARLDVAIFGIGGPAWGAAQIGREAYARLAAAAAVGEILIAPFDVNGHFIETDLGTRTIACTPSYLRDVPVSIGVASGAAKVLPILGALRSGVVNTLVIDSDTAAAVLARSRPGAAT
jgi:DNA-binding transcriptional regulator LsrR (DeoR family)